MCNVATLPYYYFDFPSYLVVDVFNLNPVYVIYSSKTLRDETPSLFI